VHGLLYRSFDTSATCRGHLEHFDGSLLLLDVERSWAQRAIIVPEFDLGKVSDLIASPEVLKTLPIRA
jgi:hypothetical protein